MDLSLTENTVDSQTIVQVRGEVDVHSAPQLRDRLTDVIDGGKKSVVVDLSRLDFIDSTGLGALVAALNHAKGTLAGTYNRHEYLDAKRAALEAWAKRVAFIAGEARDAVNVVEMRVSA